MLRQKEKERSLDSLITVFDASDDRATGLGLDFTVLKLLIAHGMDI
jgi:hypothetical protein